MGSSRVSRAGLRTSSEASASIIFRLYVFETVFSLGSLMPKPTLTCYLFSHLKGFLAKPWPIFLGLVFLAIFPFLPVLSNRTVMREDPIVCSVQIPSDDEYPWILEQDLNRWESQQ